MSDPSGSNTPATESPSRWEELARAAARGAEEEGEPSPIRQLLSFQLEGASYALPVECVREIVRIRPITPMPRVPEDVRGVISLRGEIVQVIDLRRRLSLPPAAPSHASRIIVVQDEDGRAAGMLVDAVSEVLRVTEDAILPAPPGESGVVEELCVRGDDFVSLIDLPRVLEIDAES